MTKDPAPQPVNPREFVYRGNAVAAGGVMTKLGGKPVAPDAECGQHARRELPAPHRRSVAIERPTGPSASAIRQLYRLPDIRVGTPRRGFDRHDSLRFRGHDSAHDVSQRRRSRSGRCLDIVWSLAHLHRDGVDACTTGAAVDCDQAGAGAGNDAQRDSLRRHGHPDADRAGVRRQIDGRCHRWSVWTRSSRRIASSSTISAAVIPTKPKLVFGRNKLPRTSQGYYSASIVKAIRFGDKVIEGNILATKGFGTISFGLLLSDDYSRRISMARIKMGSDAGADVGFSGVETNGIWK